MDSSPSFRGIANRQVQRHRKRQIAGLLLILATFFFIPFFRPAAIGTFVGFAILLHTYSAIRKGMICPQCAANLSYLVISMDYAGTQGAIVLPAEFPAKIKNCAYCGFSFDQELNMPRAT